MQLMNCTNYNSNSSTYTPSQNTYLLDWLKHSISRKVLILILLFTTVTVIGTIIYFVANRNPYENEGKYVLVYMEF